MKNILVCTLLALVALACTQQETIVKQIPSVRTGPRKDVVMTNVEVKLNHAMRQMEMRMPFRATAPTQWVTAYYGSWQQDSYGSTWNQENLGEPPDSLNMTGINVIVAFGNGNVNTNSAQHFSDFANTSSSAYHDLFYGANQSSINYGQRLITVAHAKGVKVVLSLQAVDPTGLNAVASSQANSDNFATFIAGFCKQWGYDGVEIDWEGSHSGNAGMMIHSLRTQLNAQLGGHPLILLSPSLNDGTFYPPSADADVDQYNIQFYAMMWSPNDKNVTWHECAVYPGTSNNGTEQALDGLTTGAIGDLQEWVNAGHDPAKIGIGIPTFGYVFNGGTTLLGPGAAPGNLVPGHNGTWTVTQNSLLMGLLKVGGTMRWDSVRQASYINGTTGSSTYGLGVKGAFFCTLMTPQGIQAIVNYIKTKTFGGKYLGGAMLYSLTEDFDPSKPAGKGRNAIHDALVTAMGGGVLPPPPPAAPTGTFSTSPASLPFGGGTVTLTWTSQNASTATINGASVALNGNQTVSITANTTWTLLLTGAGGNITYFASATVATQPPPPPPSGCNFDSVRAYWQPIYLAQGAASVHVPDSTKGYSLGFAAGAKSVVCPDTLKSYNNGFAAGAKSVPPADTNATNLVKAIKKALGL